MHLKRLVSFSLLLVFCVPILANAQWVGVNNDIADPAEVNLVSSDINTSVLQTTVDGFHKKAVTTQRGEAFIINIDNSSRILEKGSPDLPKLTGSIIIPDKNAMDIKIVDSEFTEIHNIDIAPSKGNLLRTVDPSTVPYEYGKIYQKDDFYPGKLAELNNPYIARDYRGQTVVFYPYQYNPVTKTLRVYHSIEVEVYKTSSQGINEFAERKSFKKVDREFNRIYEKHFLNFDNSRYTPLEEEGPMLVIAYTDYMDEMQDLVDWKNTIGRPTEMVDIATVGNTSSAIKTYITDYYNNNGLTYVLLVGDDAQVTTSSTTAGDSDNEYGYITGNDHYQEIFIGRFSAESEAQVTTQVQRTLDYEQGSFPANDWLNVSVGIASSQGPGDDNEYDYEHVRNMQTDLLAFTYTTNHELFDGSQGGNDDPGNPSPSDVAADVNPGAGVILYTGHGSTTSWGSSGFSNTDVNNLTNTGMLPFIWSVACVNGNFVGTTCFAEAWLRATDANGDPTGSIGMFASTINQSWNPPMEGQDEMVDILVESYTDNIKRTYGGISINGCFKMNDTYSSGGEDMTDTWTIFGDPSLMVRTDNPGTMNVTHTNGMIFGSGSLTVNCDVEDALVSITKDNDIIGTAYVSGGSADVPITGVNPGDILDVTITAFNMQPYMGNVTVIAPSGPYVIYDTYSISGENTIDYGQTQDIDITLINVGPDDASSVTATLITDDIYVTELINNQDVDFGNITGDNGTATSSGSFTVTVSDTVPDQHIIPFELTVADDNDSTWTSSFNVTANAPIVNMGFANVDVDSAVPSFTSEPIIDALEGEEYVYNIVVEEINGNGNGNGQLDPGETVNLKISATNAGHAAINNGTCELTTTSDYITVNTSQAAIASLPANDTSSMYFSITADDDTPIGTPVEFNLNLLFSDNYSLDINLTLPVGLIIEDFESGDFNTYPWTFGGDANWSIQQNEVYEGDYAAVSDDIDDDETVSLEITINVTTDDSVKFYKKVSSENNYDYFRFYIDGALQDEWCGDVDWSYEEFAVSAGSHTLKWSYEKDYIVTSGSDCAWLDYIILPPFSGSAKVERDITITAPVKPDWLTLSDDGTVLSGIPGIDNGGEDGNEVLLEATNGQILTTQEFTIFVELLNIDEINENTIFVAPNPATEKITVRSNNMIKEFRLINLSGKIVREGTVNDTEFILHTNKNIEPGTYILQLNKMGKLITKKIQIIK